MAYEHILSSGKIGNLSLRNRIMLSAMGSNYAELDGSCNSQLADYYEARAKGGTGLIILETSAVAFPSGATTPNTIGFSDDKFIPGLRDICTRVHKHGAAIAAQLSHGGKASQNDVAHGRPVYVASKPKRLKGNLMSALTRPEMANFVAAAGPDGKGARYHPVELVDIKRIIDEFTQAAVRAKTAGFDAVELHAGHGYLLSGFLSPFANDRTDVYGGSVKNRARLMCEIIASIRLATSDNFPIIVRLDAHEYRIDGGITIEDSVQYAKLAEKAGADAIDVSAYGNGLSGRAFTEAPLVHEPAGLLHFAKAVKKAVTVPVIAVGRISPELADKEIAAGNIDFVAMGRKLLAEPNLAKKLAQDPQSIRPCIYCYVCVGKIFLNQPMVCAVNPATGREQEFGNYKSVESPKNISIVGAGPAGLEAARVLAIRGHKVSVYEKADRLGGTARIAALPYAPNGDLVDWLIRSVKKLPIAIHLNTDVSAQLLAEQRPDHLVLAVGATRSAPEIPGKDLNNVFDGDELRGVLFGDSKAAQAKLPLYMRVMISSARLFGLLGHVGLLRVLSKVWMPLGKRVVLIGGGLVGLELAEFLVERGRTVTVLEPSASLGAELSVVRRARLLPMLRSAGVTLEAQAVVQKITPKLVIYSQKDEEKEVLMDTTVISLGAANNMALANQLAELNIETHNIGDGNEVGYIEGAMLSARKLAVKL